MNDDYDVDNEEFDDVLDNEAELRAWCLKVEKLADQYLLDQASGGDPNMTCSQYVAERINLPENDETQPF